MFKLILLYTTTNLCKVQNINCPIQLQMYAKLGAHYAAVMQCFDSLSFSLLSVATPTPLHCRMSLDMYFILDSTRSLKESGFQRLKEFIVSFVDMFDIGSPGNITRQGVTRVGVIEFWGTGLFPTGKYAYKRMSKVAVPLGDYKDKAELDNTINALKFKDGTITYIEAGLQKLLQDKQFGKNITGRQRVAILLSDGDEDTSVNGPESRVWMLGNASAIRGCGIQLYAVGSGKENLTNLDAITSDEANVFTTSSYKNSQGIRVKLFNRLLEQFCPNEPPLPTPSKFDLCIVECEDA